MISVIIPTLNEQSAISGSIKSAKKTKGVEIIVVDGGSIDNTTKIASSLGAKVIKSSPGRSIQMNKGAKIAKGKILLFLHADTKLPSGYKDCVEKIMKGPKVAAGAFKFSLDGKAFKYRIVEFGVILRNWLFNLPYGDQALFIRKDLFKKIGGFPNIPIMEDVALLKKLRIKGKIVIVPIPVKISARRWEKLGVIKTTLLNYLSILAFLSGIPPKKIAVWY
jgi:rSAM/selenodomain-associated transferase 2